MTITPDTLLDVTHALALNDDETTYAFELADLQPPWRPRAFTSVVTAQLQTMIDCMELTPAYVLNGRWDRIAWNRAAEHVLGDLAKEGVEFRNTMFKTFANPGATQDIENWEEIAQLVVAEFHARCGRYIQEPWMAEFVRDLEHASPKFAEWWKRRDIIYHQDKTLKIRREGELLTFLRSSFHLASHLDITVVICTPDPATDTLNWIKRKIGYVRSAND